LRLRDTDGATTDGGHSPIGNADVVVIEGGLRLVAALRRLTTLATLWRLASGWYSGRLDSPYQRTDPQSAADYFRGVGLHGPFWGLND